jgi:hypothetical protein
MYFRPAISALFASLLLLSGIGCQKPESRPNAPTILSADTIASVHWLGKRRLGYEATAFYFMRIWNLSPTARLERQTIDRLTTVPERFFSGDSNLAGTSSSALMLPLVYDLEQEESYLEIQAPTNSQPVLVLAMRLTDVGQDGRWFTNLAAILQPMTGSRAVIDPTSRGWSLKTTNVLNLIQLARVGDWTVLGIATDKNPLLAEITARIRRDGVPFISAGTNLWLEASLDLQRLASAFPFLGFNSSFSTLDHLNLTFTGDGGNVITRAKLTFSKPFSAPLESWHLPVDLMHEPLAGFTAVRGLQSWLTNSSFWHDLQIGAPPDQFFVWSLAGNPFQVYLAAPLHSAEVSALTDRLLQKGNPWLAANGYINFDRASDSNGVVWGNLSGIKPFIKSAGTGSNNWLFAGLLPDTNSAAVPPPAGMIQDVLNRTNLVYYDWEVTGPRLQPDLQLAQTARQLARQPQLPLDSASMNWLGMLIPRLGTSATIISRTGPAELTFYRRSTLGLTAPELHLLAGWLESPQFPLIP